jgi:hypothetical protein
MNRRSVLRRQIAEAWEKTMLGDYAAQRINSERSLQASVWAHLNAILPADTRRTFIEPRLSLPSGVRRVRCPDIVICSRRLVIGIVEVKYKPRGRAEWRKDLDTFRWIADNRETIRISNVRFRGVAADARSYPLSRNLLYVWAGVHAACELDLAECIEPALSSRFMALHAETHDSGPVTFRSLRMPRRRLRP